MTSRNSSFYIGTYPVLPLVFPLFAPKSHGQSSSVTRLNILISFYIRVLYPTLKRRTKFSKLNNLTMYIVNVHIFFTLRLKNITGQMVELWVIMVRSNVPFKSYKTKFKHGLYTKCQKLLNLSFFSIVFKCQF